MVVEIPTQLTIVIKLLTFQILEYCQSRIETKLDKLHYVINSLPLNVELFKSTLKN